jgi:AcrR family transcriptional regulator
MTPVTSHRSGGRLPAGPVSSTPRPLTPRGHQRIMTAVMTTVTNNRTLPRDELRRRILDAALDLFRIDGYDTATIEAVARRAEVAKGTVFNFFTTKSAILLAHYETLDAQFGEALAAMKPDAPRAALTQFFGRAEVLLRREGALIDAIVREIAASASMRRADESSGERDRVRLAGFFRACQEQGTIAAKVDAETAGRVVADIWSATVQDWIRSGKGYSLRRRLGAKLEVLFAGLAP